MAYYQLHVKDEVKRMNGADFETFTYDKPELLLGKIRELEVGAKYRIMPDTKWIKKEEEA